MEPTNEAEQVFSHLHENAAITCVGCGLTNVFIEKNQVAVCRECGETFYFSWGELASFTELKEAIYSIAIGETHEKKIDFLNAAKLKRPFWNNDFRDGRLYAEYFNLFTYLKFGPVAYLKNDRQTPVADLPKECQETAISRPETASKLPAIPANGRRQNIGGIGNSIRSGKPGEKIAVRSTQKRVNKPGL